MVPTKGKKKTSKNHNNLSVSFLYSSEIISMIAYNQEPKMARPNAINRKTNMLIRFDELNIDH